VAVDIIAKSQECEDSQKDPIGQVVEVVLDSEVVAEESQGVQVQQVGDQVDLVCAEEGSFGLVRLDGVDIGADLVENFFVDEFTQWLGRDAHEKEDKDDAEDGHEGHYPEEQGHCFDVARLCWGGHINPVFLDLIGVDTELDHKDDVIDDAKCEVAEEFVWIFQLSMTSCPE